MLTGYMQPFDDGPGRQSDCNCPRCRLDDWSANDPHALLAEFRAEMDRLSLAEAKVRGSGTYCTVPDMIPDLQARIAVAEGLAQEIVFARIGTWISACRSTQGPRALQTATGHAACMQHDDLKVSINQCALETSLLATDQRYEHRLDSIDHLLSVGWAAIACTMIEEGSACFTITVSRLPGLGVARAQIIADLSPTLLSLIVLSGDNIMEERRRTFELPSRINPALAKISWCSREQRLIVKGREQRFIVKALA
mmetsp:Transcript_45588/g.145468  ORF Transcript_45588/g.145468 Transcript_45588/m.145468 type:complete len:253 (-) Transcript_45588:394-1152(-)